MEQLETAPTRATARQFVIHECLGRGGFGEVYRATMLSSGGLDTEVAVKVLRLDLDPKSDAVSRLRDEGKLLAALRHPAILRAHDLALLDGRVALVTEFVDGADLHHCTEGVGKLTPKAAVQVIEAVAEALDAAWTRSIDGGEPLRLVHRDIKPSNIRLGSHGEVKLLDFGIARSDEVDREARTGTGSTVGSLAYMAPERFSRGSPGPEADVYALGCTLYEALGSRRLHDDPVPVEMFRLAATPDAHRRHVEESLEELPEQARQATELLRDMLQHDTSKRPTAAEVAKRCDLLADDMPGESLKRWSRARSWKLDHQLEGTFDGRTITEGTLTGSGRVQQVPMGLDASVDTFHFNHEDAFEREVTETAALALRPVKKNYMPRWVAIGLVLCGGMAILSFFGLPYLTQKGSLQFTESEDGVQIQIKKPNLTKVRSSIRSIQSNPPPVPEPADPPPVPATAVPTPPVPGPSPKVQPAPAVAPKVAPAVAAPVPEAAPAPTEPAPVALGILQVDGEGNLGQMKVELRGPSGRVPLSRWGAYDVPSGTYDLYVGGKTDTAVVVAAGVSTYIDCKPLLFTCSRKR